MAVVREVLAEKLMANGVLNPTLLNTLEQALGKKAVDVPVASTPQAAVFETMRKILTLFFAWSPINFQYSDLTSAVRDRVTREEFERLVEELKK